MRTLTHLTALFAACAIGRATEIGYNGGEQMFTALKTGTYEITIWGAAGGSNPFFAQSGGSGAEMSAYFKLSAGDVLDIYVGGAGQNAPDRSLEGGGGGGGTFVYLNGIFQIVAGGGGGAGLDSNGVAGQSTFLATAGLGAAAGAAGSPEQGGAGGDGAAGAGAEFGGGNGDQSIGGSSLPTFAGGAGFGAGNGGYGGGGGGTDSSGGGGAGFSGGGGGGVQNAGGGGSSFIFSSGVPILEMINPTYPVDDPLHNGEAEINFVTPEPAAWELAGLGLALVMGGGIYRRRRQ
jgi:hypothetical protein